MTEVTPTRDQLELGASLHLVAAHCGTSYELYARGQKARALLQSARPITDVLPWLETELRAHEAELRTLMSAISNVGRTIRADEPRRKLRRAVKTVDGAVRDLLDAAVGAPARASDFQVAVGISLLTTAEDAYQAAVTSEELDDYLTSYSAGCRALELISGSGHLGALRNELALVRAALPAVEPPTDLVDPRSLRTAVERVRTCAAAELGLPAPASGGLDEDLAKVERLLRDVVSNYQDVPALAARLAASLYVRSYDPIRAQVEAGDAALGARLTELLGVELRRAINDGVPPERVAELGREIEVLLGKLRSTLEVSNNGK
jgi:hypothetical protein